MRTTLSTLGVIIGVASLVTILALGDGLERFSRLQIEQTTDLQTILITPRTTQMVDGLSVRIEDVRTLTSDDVVAVGERLGPGFAVARQLTRSARSVAPDSVRPSGVFVVALDPPAGGLVREGLVEGSFPDDDRPMGIALSAAARAIFFPDGPAVGRSLRLDSLDFIVTGVFEGDPARRPIGVLLGLNPQTEPWMSESGRPSIIVARASLLEYVEEGLKTIDAWVETNGGPSALGVESSRARVEQASRAMLVFKLVLAAIAAVSLIVGGIGIMNVLLASVSERTREIGVRKATGARPGDIRMQFLAESVAIAGLGSVLGVMVGMAGAVGIAAVIRSLSQAPISAAFTWQSILAAAGAAIVIGLAFGTYPARRAARLSPIDAIRHE